MRGLGLALQLGWGTLRSRPTLTVLAVLLLSIGAAVLGGLAGTLYLVRNLQGEFLSALALELELNSDSDAARTAVMERTEAWPLAEFMQYVPPELTLRELEQETGENLDTLFGVNPFPPLVRVRFAGAGARTLDSLAAVARGWPEVAAVVYPQSLWKDFERLLHRLRGDLGLGIAALALGVVLLVGLCLRAQVRNRAAAWEFLQLSGMSLGALRVALLFQQLIIGLLGGLVAGALVYGLAALYGWLLMRPLSFPFGFYAAVWGASIALALLAGLLSHIRRFAVP